MRIAIVIPTGVMVHAKFALALAAMVGSIEGVDIAFVNPRSSLIASCRNIGVSEALKFEPDWILFVDADMSFPKDALARLLASDKDIIGCNYVQRQEPHMSLAWAKDGKQAVSGVVEVERLPTGFLLVRASVFSKVVSPWFEHPTLADGNIGGEDYNFCDKARAVGLQIFMDVPLSTQIVHWGEVGFAWSAHERGFDVIGDKTLA